MPTSSMADELLLALQEACRSVTWGFQQDCHPAGKSPCLLQTVLASSADQPKDWPGASGEALEGTRIYQAECILNAPAVSL